METTSIIMMIFGLGLTWGGAALCIRLAMKKNSE
ncbi:MetS family NSS transporter small subunit [Salidesulfovibrio brasiliensis]|nr:MetS family NSS transporter small subunit [Salidesulfovibrio brasiliensis]